MKHNDLTNRLLLVLLILTLIPNAIQFYNYKSYERYDWISGVISTKGNIVQVSDCNFKGNFYDINKNMILNDGWDKINEVENEEVDHLFPDSLSIKWFSYNEQKFYTGVFALPYEKILEKALDMGIKKDYTSDKILHFIAEVQPKGKVAVWMQKFNKDNTDVKFKIGTYQAKEIKGTWHIFDDYSETDTTSVININKKVALVLEKHFYKLEIKLPDGYILKDYYFELFNQNRSSFNQRELKDTVTFNFLPKEFNLDWGKGNDNFTTGFCFYENEVLNAFRNESTNNKRDQNEELILEVAISDRNDAIKVTLKNTKKKSEVLFHDKCKPQFYGSIIQIR